MSDWRKSLAIRLLVISNVLVAGAAGLSGIALLLHYDLIAYIASGLAGAGAGLAIWQWTQADKEQKQAIDWQIKFERTFTESRFELEKQLEQKEKDDYTKFLLLVSALVIGSMTIYYWRHPEKKPKT